MGTEDSTERVGETNPLARYGDVLFDAARFPQTALSRVTCAFKTQELGEAAALMEDAACQAPSLTLSAQCRKSANSLAAAVANNFEPYRQQQMEIMTLPEGAGVITPIFTVDPSGSASTRILVGQITRSRLFDVDLVQTTEIAGAERRMAVILLRDLWCQPDRTDANWVATPQIQGTDSSIPLLIGVINPDTSRMIRTAQTLLPGSVSFISHTQPDMETLIATYYRLWAMGLDLMGAITGGAMLGPKGISFLDLHGFFAMLYVLEQQKYMAPDLKAALQHYAILELASRTWVGTPNWRAKTAGVTLKILNRNRALKSKGDHWTLDLNKVGTAASKHIELARRTFNDMDASQRTASQTVKARQYSQEEMVARTYFTSLL